MGSVEFELKFVGPAPVIAGLRQSRLIENYQIGEGTWTRKRDRYFDTPDRRLNAAGLALRLRETDAKRIQIVKAAINSGAVMRKEYGGALTAGEPFPAPTGNPYADEIINGAKGLLAPIAELSFDRWHQRVRFGQSTLDIAIDLGSAGETGTGHIGAIAELEIELTAGEAGDLFEFARRVAEAHPIRPSVRNKLETAQTYMTGQRYQLSKQPKPSLDPNAPAADALQAMLAAIAERVITVQPMILDIRSKEGLRQMRIALRRFRSIERIFRKFLKGPSLYAMTRQARTIAQTLGPARDMDVFLSQTLPPIIEGPTPLDREDIACLQRAAEARRAIAWEDAYQAIAAPGFTQFALDLLEAGINAPWRAEATRLETMPLRDFAPKALDRALRKTIRVEQEMNRNLLAERHPLRIALKKQRYGTQMLAQLFPKEARQPYMAAMTRLQDALGLVNDAVVAQVMSDEIAKNAEPGAMRAAGFIAGFKAAEATAAARHVDAAWKDFEETTPFWRETYGLHTNNTLP